MTERPPSAAPAKQLRHRWLLLLAILVIALALRFWHIDRLPPGFHFDEAFEGLEAWRILTEPGYRPVFLTGNFGVPPLNAYANALTFALFGMLGGEAGPTAMRVTAGFFGVLGVIALYALGVELTRLDRRPAGLTMAFPLFASAVLAVMRWHIHFSRMGIEPILVPLIWAASNWLLLRGWRTSSWLSFAGCGAVLAAGMYAYQGAWVIPLLMIPFVLHLLLDDHAQADTPRGLAAMRANLASPRGRGLLIAAGAALLLVLPLIAFFARNLDLVFLRPTQLVIVGQTGSPADSSLLQSLWATAKMFGPLGAPGDLDPRRNLPGAPAINLWLAAPFYLGAAVAIWRVRRPAYSLLLIGLVGLLLPGIFSEYAPHFHRILGASAPAAMLCGVGLDAIWRWRPQQLSVVRWAAVALLVLALAATIRDYFVRWASLPALFYAFDVGLWQSGQWVAAQQGENTIYVTPRGDEHATLGFAWRARPIGEQHAVPSRPVAFDGRHVFPYTRGVAASPEQYVVIEHEDFRTGLLLPEVLPDATVDLAFQDPSGRTYAQIYTRPAHRASAWEPAIASAVSIGDGISLAGYETLPETLRAGEILYVRLAWDVDDHPTANWTVYTHLVNPQDGSLIAGFDSAAGHGSLATDRWEPGWRVIDEVQIALPADLPPGEYALDVGLYGSTGETLPADGAGVRLGVVQIE